MQLHFSAFKRFIPKPEDNEIRPVIHDVTNEYLKSNPFKSEDSKTQAQLLFESIWNKKDDEKIIVQKRSQQGRGIRRQSGGTDYYENIIKGWKTSTRDKELAWAVFYYFFRYVPESAYFVSITEKSWPTNSMLFKRFVYAKSGGALNDSYEQILNRYVADDSEVEAGFKKCWIAPQAGGSAVQEKPRLLPSYPDKDMIKGSYQPGRPEFDEAKEKLEGKKSSSITLTTAVYGSGGYGKSSLAQELCDDENIRKKFPGGIYWLQFGQIHEKDGTIRFIDLATAIQEMLKDQYPRQPLPVLDLADRNDDIGELLKILPDKKLLIIADDVWAGNQAGWIEYLEDNDGFSNDVSVLVTTRIESVASRTKEAIPIKRLTEETAIKLLTHGMGDLTRDQETRLSKISGGFKGWPLLLDLANSVFRRLDRKTPNAIEDAIENYEAFLFSDEIDGFDVHRIGEEDAVKRQKLVGYCIEVSLNAIHPEMNPERVRQLGIFPDEAEIPVSVIIDFWLEDKGAALNAFKAGERLKHFRDFSLFQSTKSDSKTVKLHDEILAYFRSWNRKEGSLQGLHEQLIVSLQKYCSDGWHTLPSDHEYGWDLIHHHLEQSGHAVAANELRTDFDWIKKKLAVVGIVRLRQTYLSRDLDDDADLIGRAIGASSSVLAKRPNELAHQLFGRLGRKPSKRIKQLIAEAKSDVSYWPIPAYPHLNNANHLTHKAKLGRRINSAVFNHDGSRVVIGCYDGTSSVWDSKYGEQVSKYPMTHDGPVNSAMFNHDGNWVVTASGDGTARVWDIKNGERVNGQSIMHGSRINSAMFNHDGSRIVTASDDRTACIWDTKRGERVNNQQIQHNDWINGAMFNHDGSRVVTASYDRTACVWDTERGERVNNQQIQHNDWVNSAMFNHDGSRVVTASYDGTACVWDTEHGVKVNKQSMRHNSRVTSAKFNRDGSRVVTSSYDGTVCVWDTEHGVKVNQKTMEHGDRVSNAIFNYDGSRIVAASDNGAIWIWDTESGESLAAISFDSKPTSINYCNEIIVVGLLSGDVCVFYF